MNKKMLAIIIPIVVLIVAGIGVLSYMLLSDDGGSTGDVYLERIQSAEKCLSNHDYDNAILFYQKAIEEDDKREEAYIGLAKVYHDYMNNTEQAIIVLRQGYERTGSSAISRLLDEYGLGLPVAPADDLKAVDAGSGVMFNTRMIDTLATNTYKDYSTKYSVETALQDNGGYSATYTQLSAHMIYENQPNMPAVINSETGLPYDAARPTLIIFNDIAAVMPKASGNLTVKEIEDYGVANPEVRNSDVLLNFKYMTFVYRGCRFYIAIDDNNCMKYPDGYVAMVPPANLAVAESGKVSLSGSVIDVTTGRPVNNTSLSFFKGSTLIDAVNTVNGVYNIELDPGDYNVLVAAEGYIEEAFRIILTGSDKAVQDFSISPALAAGQIRVVLEWGAAPRDLDSHLEGTASDGSRVSIDFMNRVARSGNKTYAELDLDDQDGYGPETITISDVNGSYHYFVYLYAGTGTIADSGVTVKVYTSDSSSPMIFTPRAGHTGRQWDVFSIEKGEIRVDDADRG